MDGLNEWTNETRERILQRDRDERTESVGTLEGWIVTHAEEAKYGYDVTFAYPNGFVVSKSTTGRRY